MIIPGKLRNHIKLERLDRQRNAYGEVKINWLTVIEKTWAEISDPSVTRHESTATADDMMRTFSIKIRNRDSLRAEDLTTDLRVIILDGPHKDSKLEVVSLEITDTEIDMELSDGGRN